MHGGIKKNFAGMETLMGRASFGMPRTYKGAIRKNDRRSGSRDIEFWNGNGDLGRIDEKLHIAEAQGLTWEQFGLLDGIATEKRTVGGSAIPNHDFAVSKRNFAVISGNC